jgi:large subunit ribosomal protein L29
MSAKDLRGKEPKDLQAEVIKLRREQFSLRMQAASGQSVKSSDFGKVKRSIARVKTVMREKLLSSKTGAAAAGAKK